MSEESLVNVNAEGPVTETTEATTTEDTTNEQSGEQLLAGKYKTQEEYDKAFKHLESENGRLRREKGPEAPEKYEFSNEGLEGFEDVTIDAEDPMLQEFQEVFKGLNLSNEQANRLVHEFAKRDSMATINPEKEMEALGDKGKEIIGEIENFLGKNQKALGFEDGEIEALAAMSATANGVKALHKIMGRVQALSIPEKPTGETMEDPADLIREAMEFKNSKGFDRNPDNIAKYQTMMQKAAKLKIAQGK